MGNALPHRPSDATGKVILQDGTIHQYDEPVTVAELMLEYPQKVVIEFQQATSGRKPVPLPADKKLEMNKVYLMLPIKRGKPAALSTEQVRSLVMIANTFLKSKSLLASSTGFLPLFARMCSAGAGKQHEFALDQRKRTLEDARRQRDQEATKPELFTDYILDSRPEFLSRQLSGKGWKPSLDTIAEKNVKTKVKRWLF